jgi:putative membrane protein
MRSIKDYALLYLKGAGMGAADVVPGVSGGTIAFITGIYEELLDSIKSFNLDALQLIKQGQFKGFWQHINGTFLVVLLAGVFTSLLTLSRLITWLLATYPIQLWSFFFGLIIISAILVTKEIRKWNAAVVIAGIIGIAIAYLITVVSPGQTPDNLWFIFIAGAIAICAMILPGISGSFILLLLVKYEFILNAVKELNIPVIIVFGLGCVTGLLSFARVVSWLLDRYYNVAVALLAGFMIGSLNKVWPWKVVTEYYMDSKGVQKPLVTESVWPTIYAISTGQQAHVLWAVLFAALGILLVVGIEKVSKYSVSPDH